LIPKFRYYWWKNSPEEYNKSRDYFYRAVEEDPTYALGYCGLNSFSMKRARRASKISDQTEHVYGECRYATKKTWPWKRRIIYKAEVVRAEGKEPKDNPRFVVTNLKQSPQWIYEQVYCQRGDVENRIIALGKLGRGETEME
jgi:hypothetical protein